MCQAAFEYVNVDKDSERMILCRIKDYNETVIQQAIRRAFPETVDSIWKRLYFKRIPTQAVRCWKMYASWFSGQICKQEQENDWGKHPFVALRAVREGDRIYCKAWVV